MIIPIGKKDYHVDLMIFRWGSCWIGAHRSPQYKSVCIALIPCVVIRIGLTPYTPEEKLPGAPVIDEPITEAWLKAAGFKWSQLDRQPDKHWILWLGSALNDGGLHCSEELGIEVAPGVWPRGWFCWVRCDCSHRYHRFLHIRHIETTGQLVQLIEALTGRKWNPANNWYGAMCSPERAEYLRREYDRLDQRLLRDYPKWSDIEKDDTMAGATSQHLEAHEKAKLKTV